MKNKPRLKLETYEQTREIVRIGNATVKRAQEENRKCGVANVYSRNGKLIYEMPDGTIVIKDLQKNG